MPELRQAWRAYKLPDIAANISGVCPPLVRPSGLAFKDSKYFILSGSPDRQAMWSALRPLLSRESIGSLL